MPKVAQTDLVAFGREVKRARSLKGWTLDQLAGQLSPVSGKSFLSNVEKGKRAIGPLTVGKLIKALDLPDIWIDRFLDADVAPEDEETRTDREADRLLVMVEKDPTAPATAEPLLLLLAEEWAGKGFTDPSTAYTALRGALQAAADLRAQGTLPSNASDQLQAILRRVADLNDQGQMEEADAALKDASDRNAAEADALFDAHLKQDRLRNRPEAAAQRMIAQLKRKTPQENVFNAMRNLIKTSKEHGGRQGIIFDLNVALEIAKSNRSAAVGPTEILTSLSDLGLCYLSVGEFDVVESHFAIAERCFRRILGFTKANIDPSFWADTQGNLAIVLQTLGRRRADSSTLAASVKAFDNALEFLARDRDPIHWAITTKNLANSLAILGELNRSVPHVSRAIDAYELAITVLNRKSFPHLWAETTSMLGNALSVRGELSSSKDDLASAIVFFNSSLEIFTRQEAPHFWSRTQNNLGLSHCSLAMLSSDHSQLDAAQECFKQCLLDSTFSITPNYWAETQWNLARLAFAKFELTDDGSHLPIARVHALAARAVFARARNNLTASIDRLLAEIDAHEAGVTPPHPQNPNKPLIRPT